MHVHIKYWITRSCFRKGSRGRIRKVIKSWYSMKPIHSKAKQQQGLKVYLGSLQAPIHILENTFSELELKGKPITIFKPHCDEEELIQALHKLSKTGTHFFIRIIKLNWGWAIFYSYFSFGLKKGLLFPKWFVLIISYYFTWIFL